MTSKSVTEEVGWWSSSICSDGARPENDKILILFSSFRRLLLSGEILNMHTFPVDIGVWFLLSFEFYSPEYFILSLGYTFLKDFPDFLLYWKYFLSWSRLINKFISVQQMFSFCYLWGTLLAPKKYTKMSKIFFLHLQKREETMNQF